MHPNTSSSMVKTRFAPSPTGSMHIGGVRTALYAYLVAKKNNGIFFLRIEDTDRTRFVEGSTEDIIKTLDWLGLKFDGEPFFQSKRIDIYKEHSKKLIDSGKAYEKDGAVWFKVKTEGKSSIVDLVGNRKIEFDNSSEKDFVILKSDGYPTYHLAHVVDDHLMETNPVIRGAEWISSVPKHVMLFEAFGWEVPQYAHLPIILGPDKSKLSKRHGAKPASEFRKDGFLKEAVLNFMALLGWNPGGDKEFLTLDEMIKLFDLKDVNSSSPIFDLQKLTWMNGEYIRMMNDELLIHKLRDFYRDDKDVLSVLNTNPGTMGLILGLAKTRMKTLKEFEDLVVPKRSELSEVEKKVAKNILNKFLAISNWNKDSILTAMRETLTENKIKGKILYKIITGYESGLPLPESLEILGKEKTLERLRKHLDDL